MKTKFRMLMLLVCIGILALMLVACIHEHEYSEWMVEKQATCTEDGTEFRLCKCGERENRTILAKGHTEVADVAVPATCTTDGKTAGTHCSTCHTILNPQTIISAIGHDYDEGVVVTEATCLRDGTMKYTCQVAWCGHSYNDTYSLPTYTATEIYNQSLKYVGEMTTYDKKGEELALGTGFLISADGKVVTNYHVIDGAYSAKIKINGTTYNIESVLAYDADIDLAVLKIYGNDFEHATVCQNAVSVGDTVYAIGSSRGMTNTYSQGIVTYANREVDGVVHVQHDASIASGNSGGPLINAYGEVVGINSWEISNSQNLNFAVFSAELGNLTYGAPLSMAEFYEKECNAFAKMKAYIIDNGTYLSGSNSYRLIHGSTYSSDYSSKYTRIAYYYVESDSITLDFLIDDGDTWLYFKIDEQVDGSYFWSYFDDYGYDMSGMLYAATYNGALLEYSYNNITYSSTRNSVQELASVMMDVLISWIDTDFAKVDVTAQDIGFLYY